MAMFRYSRFFTFECIFFSQCGLIRMTTSINIHFCRKISYHTFSSYAIVSSLFFTESFLTFFFRSANSCRQASGGAAGIPFPRLIGRRPGERFQGSGQFLQAIWQNSVCLPLPGYATIERESCRYALCAPEQKGAAGPWRETPPMQLLERQPVSRPAGNPSG